MTARLRQAGRDARHFVRRRSGESSGEMIGVFVFDHLMGYSTNPILGQLATYPTELLYKARQDLRARGVQVFDFSVGDPIEPTDPSIVRAFKDGTPTVSQYPSALGTKAFRDSCSAWLKRRFSVEVDPDGQILPSSGSKEAIFHLPLAFIDRQSPRKRVLFGTPAYPVYERGTLFAGGTPWSVTLDPDQNYLLQPWTLAQTAIDETAMIWVNYPHNPTAAVADLGYLEKLASFCQDNDIILCCDECYVDLYFGEPPPSILQVTSKGVIAIHSLSKRSGMTGYRSGFVSGDRELLQVLRKCRPNFGTASTAMVQQAAIAAWQDDNHVQQRRDVFRAKRDVFVALFDDIGLRHAPCDATLYLWVHCPGNDPLQYAKQLAEQGILVSPGPYLGVDEPYVRVALVPSIEHCREAAEIWRKIS